MNTDVMFSSVDMSWETPIDIFNELNSEFKFTLDPCASDTNHKCDKYYTEADDGLSKSWKDENVFVNPPYGRELSKWVEKCYKESIESDGKIVMLIPARTDTKYFHKYIYHKSEIRFLKGRIKFLQNGEVLNSAPFPSMVVIYH